MEKLKRTNRTMVIGVTKSKHQKDEIKNERLIFW